MISAPKGTPKEPMVRMNAAVDRVLKDPVVIAWMQNFGSPSSGAAGSPQELSAFVREEILLWGQMISGVGLEAQ
jgi:tripartite-type tricarboxylate transporter receptor subunit TctC